MFNKQFCFVQYMRSIQQRQLNNLVNRLKIYFIFQNAFAAWKDMKEAKNSLNSASYVLTLTQSLKRIKKNQRQKATLTFQQQTRKIMRMMKGASFWNLAENFQPIYNNFNLLSYLSPSCQLKVISRINGSTFAKVSLFTFGFAKQLNFLMIQKRKDQLSRIPQKGKPLTINLQIIPCPIKQTSLNFQKQVIRYIQNPNKQTWVRETNEIIVQFETDQMPILDDELVFSVIKEGKMLFLDFSEVITIKVFDKKGWFSKTIKLDESAFGHRISDLRKPRIGEIQYFYLEPSLQRNKQFKEENLMLALQGGGCKGVQYIGAYKALRNCKPGTKIASVIGSSAGGILGLAIALSLEPQQIQKLCIQKLSKVTQDKKYKKVDQEGQRVLTQTFEQVFSAIQNFNIFQPKLLDIIKSVITDPQIQQGIVELIEAVLNPEVSKLFVDTQVIGNAIKKNLNLLGFLNGSLMTGNVIKDIAVSCIKIYLQTQRKKNPDKINKLLNSSKFANMTIDSISEALNMRQLYQLTGVQLTCTAVDLKFHVLRFFNQKTSPFLPVCRAVQMSGSFPVAFQAQVWKQSWGKYYIHFDTIRRQINLTGSQLTDGGTLANFPLKYLDNEDMRPMYFSHKKGEKTEMYGIGLTSQIPNKEEVKKDLSGIIGKIANRAISLVGLCSPFCSWISYKLGCSKPTQKTIIIDKKDPLKDFKKVPVIEYGIKLLQTFSKSKDRLVEECFSHYAYETSIRQPYYNEIKICPKRDKISENIGNLQKSINELFHDRPRDGPSLLKILKQNLLEMGKFERLNQLQEKYICDLSDSLYEITSVFLFEFLEKNEQKKDVIVLLHKIACKKITPKLEPQQIIKELLEIIQNVYFGKHFVLCNLEQDLKSLQKITQIIVQFLQQLIKNEKTKNLMFDYLVRKRNQQDNEIKTITSSLRRYAQVRKQKDIVDRRISYSLNKIKFLFITNPLQKLKKALKLIRYCQVSDLFISEEADSHRQLINSYTIKRIQQHLNKGPQDGVHLVMESIALSEIYFYYYFEIVQDSILRYNLAQKGRNMKITTMTSTGYHSLIIFLLASDLSHQRINQEVWKLKDLIKMDKENLMKCYNEADWAKLTPILLKQIEKEALMNKKDIFRYIEQDIIKNDKNYNVELEKVKLAVQGQIKNVRISNQQLISSIEVSLNYIIKVLSELELAKVGPGEVSKQLKRHLLLSKNPKKTQAVQSQFSLRVKSILTFFYDKYSNVVQHIALSSPYVVEQVLKLLDPSQRQLVWKGLILSEFLSVKPIKEYVQGILEQLKLDKNITLKQFYDLSQKKIQINFSVIEDEYLSIYNHISTPNMPVWVAIVGASSTPHFFPPLLNKNEWRKNKEKYKNKRDIKNYFGKQDQPYTFIVSSDPLTRFPLDLLQNNKFQKMITDKYNQIYLVFNFNEPQFKSIYEKPVEQFTIKCLTLGECVSKFLSFKSILCRPCSRGNNDYESLYDEQKNIQGLKNFFHIPFMQSKFKQLSLYIDAHDNLIVKIYKKELVQMPIRFTTLDFHMMTQKCEVRSNGKLQMRQTLSNVCRDTIMQAEYILSQKIINKKCQEKVGEEVKKKERVIFFRVESIPSLNNRPKLIQKIDEQSLDNSNAQIKEQQNIEQTSSVVKPGVVYVGQKNALNIRFLSVLNPSKDLNQRFYIYYANKARKQEIGDEQIDRLYDLDGTDNESRYVKLIGEELKISYSEYQTLKKLQLKIIFPSPSEDQIKTSYFQLYLDDFFHLNETLLHTNQNNSFGFIYSLQYQKITPQVNLNPINSQSDYMNVATNIKKIPRITIKSDIRETIYRSNTCQKCVQPLQFCQESSGDAKMYICKSCGQTDSLINRFKLEYRRMQKSENPINCVLGHSLIRYESRGKNFESLQFPKCDTCLKACIEEYWSDEQCKIRICDQCRISSLGI